MFVHTYSIPQKVNNLVITILASFELIITLAITRLIGIVLLLITPLILGMMIIPHNLAVI